MPVKDYYKELGISQSLETSAIKEELSKQESIWRKREINNPEKATFMLALIMEAQKKFKDDLSRKDYDYSLEQSKKKPIQENPDGVRMESFKEWWSKADSYYENKKMDLAKTAIEKALSYMPTDYENAGFFNLLAKIYRDNNDTNTAMDYINKAIVIDEENPEYIITKGFILIKMGDAPYVNILQRQELQEQGRMLFYQARELAIKYNNDVVRGNIAGVIAHHHYFLLNDEATAELMAEEAIAFGETWGNGNN